MDGCDQWLQGLQAERAYLTLTLTLTRARARARSRARSRALALALALTRALLTSTRARRPKQAERAGFTSNAAFSMYSWSTMGRL